MQAEQEVFDGLVKEHRDEIMELRRNRDRAGLQALQDDLVEETQALVKEKGLGKLSDARKEAYTTVGGTPFLDGQYTVFGEVESGLDLVGQIQECATDANDRPLEDIAMTVTVIEE